jgi:hypothetical protein
MTGCPSSCAWKPCVQPLGLKKVHNESVPLTRICFHTSHDMTFQSAFSSPLARVDTGCDEDSHRSGCRPWAMILTFCYHSIHIRDASHHPDALSMLSCSSSECLPGQQGT